MRNYKPVTITVRTDVLENIKHYCEQANVPLSRFFSACALEKVQTNLIEEELVAESVKA